MPNDALSKIRMEAKRIRKQHPNMKWTAAIKQASKKYNSGSMGKRMPKAKKRVSGIATKSKTHTDKNRITANIQVGKASVAGLRSSLIKALSSEYADLASKLVKETSKRAGNAIKAKMRATLAEMKRLNEKSK